jgi:hypothetical protein
VQHVSAIVPESITDFVIATLSSACVDDVMLDVSNDQVARVPVLRQREPSPQPLRPETNQLPSVLEDATQIPTADAFASASASASALASALTATNDESLLNLYHEHAEEVDSDAESIHDDSIRSSDEAAI